MKNQISLAESYIRARITGIILIIIGAIILINPTDLNMKISFLLILLGIFMIFIITDRSIPKKMSDVQIEGNIDALNRLIKELNFYGNAIFLPKSNTLSEERIFIPPNKSGIVKIPDIDDHISNIIITGKNGENLGISIPPAGLKLIKEIENDKAFQNINPENIDDKLQLLVGINLLKSVSFKKQQYGWDLEIEKSVPSENGGHIETQYPCPICSAVIILITRAFNTKIRIYNVTFKGNKITFHLNIIKKRETPVNKT